MPQRPARPSLARRSLGGYGVARRLRLLQGSEDLRAPSERHVGANEPRRRRLHHMVIKLKHSEPRVGGRAARRALALQISSGVSNRTDDGPLDAKVLWLSSNTEGDSAGCDEGEVSGAVDALRGTWCGAARGKGGRRGFRYTRGASATYRCDHRHTYCTPATAIGRPAPPTCAGAATLAGFDLSSSSIQLMFRKAKLDVYMNT